MARNKELLDQYKQREHRMGVCAIRNTANGKVLIGSGLNLDALWNRHRSELNFGSHRNERLQAEWKQQGEAAFVFEVLSEMKREESVVIDYAYEVRKLEALFIEELQPWGERGYHNDPKA